MEKSTRWKLKERMAMTPKPFLSSRRISSGRKQATGRKMIPKTRMKETYMTSIIIGTGELANRTRKALRYPTSQIR